MKKLAIFLWLVLFVALLAVPAKAVEIIEIFLGESVIGNLSHTADRNYYKLYVSEGEHIFVNLENHLDQELEVRIYIKYGAVPPEAGYDDCDYWIDPGEEGIVEINPTNEGYYYITTISESGSGSYTITAFNENLFGEVLLPGESVIGNLSHTADRNYYKLYVSEGEHIFVNLENHLDQELEVRIYIKYGAVPPEAGWDDCDYWIDPGEEGIVEINPTNEGYYYITTISESGSGYYTITALGSAHPPFPIVDITLNKNTFHTGDTLIATARVTNGPNPVNVEVKLWIELPDGSEISVFDPHFTFTVGSNADFTEEVFIHTFDGSEPEGDYLFGARLENPLTGKDFSIDIEGFTFTP